MAVLAITKCNELKALRLGFLVQSWDLRSLATQGRLLLHAAKPPLPYENSVTEPGHIARGPKDPPSDQSTYQDPDDDEDIQDEGNPDEPDEDEDCSEMRQSGNCQVGP
jgi:hypothetical protein